MFSHYSRVLASVPRWSVVPVTRRQYVAEHSYYVSLYTAELLGLSLFDNWDSDRKFACVRYALIHDAAEARMADTPGPVKRMTVDREKFDEVERMTLRHMGFVDKWECSWHVDDGIKVVVKAADLIDEFFYLNMEASMGSKIVDRLLGQIETRLMAALGNLPGITEIEARDLFTVISREVVKMDTGIETLSNNDDVAKARGGYVADCTENNRCGRIDCAVCDGVPF